MRLAVPLPVVGILCPPLLRAVIADLAVIRIRSHLVAMVFSSSPPLALRGSANGLLWMKSRRVEGTLAIPTRLLKHSSSVTRFCFQPETDLETAVECYRVLANWGRSPRPPRRACRPPHPPC